MSRDPNKVLVGEQRWFIFLGDSECIPGLPESTHITCYVARDSEVWRFGVYQWIGLETACNDRIDLGPIVSG